MMQINIRSFESFVKNFYSFKDLSNEQLFELLEVYNCLLVFSKAPGYDLIQHKLLKDKKALTDFMTNDRKIL